MELRFVTKFFRDLRVPTLFFAPIKVVLKRKFRTNATRIWCEELTQTFDSETSILETPSETFAWVGGY